MDALSCDAATAALLFNCQHLTIPSELKAHEYEVIEHEYEVGSVLLPGPETQILTSEHLELEY